MSRFFEEYKPKDLSEVVFSAPTIMPIFQSIANGTATTNLLLYGPVGTGKTAIAKLITELYYTNRDESDWTTFIDLTEMKDFTRLRSMMTRSTAGFTDRWWFILDEGDKLPTSQMTMMLNQLHNIIGKYGNCNFIITTNSLGHMPAGIKSRCYPIVIDPPTPEQFLQRAKDIVAAEGKSATDDEIINWLSIGDNDIRHYLTMLDMNLAFRPKSVVGQQQIKAPISAPTSVSTKLTAA